MDGNEYRALKLTQFIRGWVNYFGMADMKSMLRSNDEWLHLQNKGNLLETMEESQDKIQRTQEVRR